MSDPSREVFDNYEQHYANTGARNFRNLLDVQRFRLDRLPRWIGDTAKQARFVLHPPMLFWSWQHPLRALLRVLNRVRWHLSAWTHRAAGLLFDTQPKLRCHEIELEVVARK